MQSSLFLASREVSCHHTLRWMPFFKCTLASSRRCVANNFFIYSSHPRYSRLVAASWSWKCNSARNRKSLRNAHRVLPSWLHRLCRWSGICVLVSWLSLVWWNGGGMTCNVGICQCVLASWTLQFSVSGFLGLWSFAHPKEEVSI